MNSLKKSLVVVVGCAIIGLSSLVAMDPHDHKRLH